VPPPPVDGGPVGIGLGVGLAVTVGGVVGDGDGLAEGLALADGLALALGARAVPLKKPVGVPETPFEGDEPAWGDGDVQAETAVTPSMAMVPQTTAVLARNSGLGPIARTFTKPPHPAASRRRRPLKKAHGRHGCAMAYFPLEY
jgi:hypothetical protein